MEKKYLTDNIRPFENEIVRVKSMGNITEVMFSRYNNFDIRIQKLDNENYILLETGELKTFQHIENRSDDLNSVRVSLGKLRDYLNTNIDDVTFCKWLTLTYAENMTDTKQLMKDYEKFVKKLRYHYGFFEYIVAMEPQGRGAWHCHIVMIFDKKALYIPKEHIAEIWGHGTIVVKKLDNVDNVGAYLTAYLGDMEFTEYCDSRVIRDGEKIEIKEVDYLDENGQALKKKYVKGARLAMYPPNFNLYRCSQGIKQPLTERMRASEAEKKTSADTLTFEKTISLSDEGTGFQNIINYRYYNLKRSKSQSDKI